MARSGNATLSSLRYRTPSPAGSLLALPGYFPKHSKAARHEDETGALMKESGDLATSVSMISPLASRMGLRLRGRWKVCASVLICQCVKSSADRGYARDDDLPGVIPSTRGCTVAMAFLHFRDGLSAAILVV